MDYMENVRKNLKLEDLEPKYREIAEIIGVENYIKLCDAFGGGSLYIPTGKEAIKRYVYSKVVQAKGILTARQLSQMYGISMAKIYQILREAKEE